VEKNILFVLFVFYWPCNIICLILETLFTSFAYFHLTINPLTPELNPPAQRCLARFLMGILLFVNMREKPTNPTVIDSVY
jgi:hypothetical protein